MNIQQTENFKYFFTLPGESIWAAASFRAMVNTPLRLVTASSWLTCRYSVETDFLLHPEPFSSISLMNEWMNERTVCIETATHLPLCLFFWSSSVFA